MRRILTIAAVCAVLCLAKVEARAQVLTYNAPTNTAVIPYPSPIPCPFNSISCSAGNGSLTGAGYVWTPTDYPNTPFLRVTDVNTVGTQHSYTTSCDASSEVNLINLLDNRFTICQTGNRQLLYSYDAPTNAATQDTAFVSPGAGSMFFSYTQPYIAYHGHLNGSNDLAIFSYDTSGLGNPAATQVVDLGTACSIAGITGNAAAAVTEGISVSGDDQSFGVDASSTAGQSSSGNIYVVGWSRATGCSYWNTSTGHVFNNGVDQGAIGIADSFTLHNVRIGKGGTWMKVQIGTCLSSCTAGATNYAWQIGTTTVNVATQANTCGHTAAGYTLWVNKCNGATGFLNGLFSHPFTTPNTFTSLPTTYPSPQQSNGAHINWSPDNSSDTQPFFAIMQAPTFAVTDGWDNDVLAVSTSGSGSVYRLFHTYATPQVTFVPGGVSADGKLILLTTDYDGMFGKNDNVTTPCTTGVGGNCRTEVLLATLPLLSGQPWVGLLNPLDSSFPGTFSAAPAYGIDWSMAGVGGIPARTTICNTLSASGADQHSVITSALSACPVGQTVLLNPGTFVITGSVSVPSGRTLRGSGPNSTILNCNGTGTGCVTGGGGDVAKSLTTVTAGATIPGGTSLTLASVPAAAVVGNLMIITEPNNPAWVNPTGNEGVNGADDGWGDGAAYARGQIVQITNVAGNVVTFTPGMYGTYANGAVVVPFAPSADHVGIENLQLFGNSGSGYASGVGGLIFLSQCAFCWAKGIEYNYSPGNPIGVAWGYRDEVRDSYISNAFTHGPGDTDAAIFVILKTSASLVENNIIERMHVSVMLNWGAAGNVVAYNYGEGNFDTNATNITMSSYNHHGAHPQFNLFEGNVGGQMYLDDVWGTNSHDTSFRGWYQGTYNICTPFTSSTRATVTAPCHQSTQVTVGVQVASNTTNQMGSEYHNFIGDVVGSAQAQALSSTRATFMVSPTNRGAFSGFIQGYDFGYGEPGDSTGACSLPNSSCSEYQTSLRHGIYSNYDGTTTWSGALTHTLPPSFYLSSKPSFWPGTMPWPSIGPDVTGGSGPGGHAWGNAASNCYLGTMGGSDGGVGSPRTFNPSSCYGSAAPAPIFSPNTGTIPCGNVAVGSSNTCPSVTITNTGSANLVTSSVSVTGASAAQFTLPADNCISTITPGSSCTVTAQFNPTSSGAASAAIQFTDNATGSPHSVALTGTGTAPAVSLTTSSVACGSVVVGQNTTCTVVTLTSSGTSTLNISSITASGAGFSSTNTCPATLAPNATCTITPAFAPLSLGSLSGSISITDNALDSPQAISLSGTGTNLPTAAFSVSSVNCGNSTVTAPIACTVVTFTNTGTASITISSKSVSGANAADYSEADNCPGTLTGGASCSVTPTFTPSTTGTRTATVSFVSTSSTSPNTFSLTGSGTVPPPILQLQVSAARLSGVTLR